MTMAGVKEEAGPHTEEEIRALKKRIKEMEAQMSKIFRNNALVEGNPISVDISDGIIIRSSRLVAAPSGPVLWQLNRQSSNKKDKLYVSTQQADGTWVWTTLF